MATISVSLPSDGQTADAADYNVPINTIVSAINGGLDSNNIAASGVATTNIATGIQLANKEYNPYKFSAYRNAAFNATSSSAVIVFDTENFDTNSNFSTSTGLYTAPVAGFYWFAARSGLSTSTSNEVLVTLQKNGADNSTGGRGISTGTQSGLFAVTVSNMIQLAASDTVGVTIYSNSTTGAQAGPSTTYFSGILLSGT